MVKQIYTILVLTISLMTVHAQETWQLVEGEVPVRSTLEREIIPTDYKTFLLDQNLLKKQLHNAPHQDDVVKSINGASIEMPMPDGSTSTYSVWEAPVMAPGISARYPNIKTYKGYNTATPDEVIRFDISEYGVRAGIRSADGEIYIDPYVLGQTDYYLSYYTKDDPTSGLADGALQCGVDDHGHEIDQLLKEQGLERRSVDGEIVDLRTYRLAMAGTAEWCNVRGTVERCLADVNTAINRLNLIWENEASISMQIIDRNDELFFFDPGTEPYTDTRQGRLLIGQNTTVLNSIIGASSYDIGHVFSRCFDVGGIAARPSVCLNRKGNAVTCANGSNPTRWAVGTLAHEVGHQFSMNHSFNHCDGDNEAPAAGFEPGSGSTIMSYAGLCGAQLNVQSDNDDYFHLGSLIEAYSYTRDGGLADECSQRTVTGNRAPIIDLPYEDGLVIPISTPFELTGDATDPDGDNMTYNWEQMDSGPLSSRGAPIGNAPLFRSLYPGASKTRVFPALESILTLSPSPNEVLPTQSRDVTLAFVARDNHPLNGTASWQMLEMQATANAGPFRIEYPNSFIDLTVGEEVEVLWDVANTDSAPVNATEVDIYLSTDGGYTYPTVLARDVPNDGAQTVVLPNSPTLSARIKVKASQNVFFDLTDRNFEIVAPTEPTFTVESGAIYRDVCLPEAVEVALPTASFNDYAEQITFEVVEGLPAGADVTFSPATITAGEASTMILDISNAVGSGTFEITIAGVGADNQIVTRTITLNTTGTDFSTLEVAGAADGGVGTALSPTLEWTSARDATYYRVELASSPSFEQSTIIFSTATEDLSASPNLVLDAGSIFYWRVSAGNDCGEATSSITAFSTESLACETYESTTLPRAIGTTTGGINVRIPVNAAGQADDVNVKRIAGDHTRIGDLSATLTSPSGTVVQLWNPRCATQQDYDLTLDDDAPNDISCPLRGGQLYRPDGMLSDFNGEQISGEWTLRVQDNRSGNGGSVDIAQLEICGNVTLSPPILITNETAIVDRSKRTVIGNASIATTDDNHSASQVVFTLVEAAISGDIVVDGQAISAGGEWTQEDVNRGRLAYRHNGDDATDDAIQFTVRDPDGGFIQVTTLDISIVGVVSSDDVALQSSVNIYPNPAREQLTIDVELSQWAGQDIQAQLYNYTGQIILQSTIGASSNTIDLGNVESGIYLIALSDGEQRLVKKVSIIR